MAEIWINILAGFKEIFSAPFRDPSILWLLIPIMMFWFVLEIYFDKYKGEKIGWNTALGYGLSMFWIVVISLKTLFENNFELFSIDKLLFLILIALYSVFIIYVSFTHRLKEKIFFLFASPSLIYYLFGIAILLVHDLISLSLWVIIDLVILYIIILIIEFILRKLIPVAPSGSGTEDTGIGNTGLGDIGKF
ncbi:MAG: hypothetical protein IIC69_00995 [Nanoarchaeota archaeon]|nr:hypothetical protein [Nanoarchaeota archaeon]